MPCSVTVKLSSTSNHIHLLLLQVFSTPEELLVCQKHSNGPSSSAHRLLTLPSHPRPLDGCYRIALFLQTDPLCTALGIRHSKKDFAFLQQIIIIKKDSFIPQ